MCRPVAKKARLFPPPLSLYHTESVFSCGGKAVGAISKAYILPLSPYAFSSPLLQQPSQCEVVCFLFFFCSLF